MLVGCAELAAFRKWPGESGRSNFQALTGEELRLRIARPANKRLGRGDVVYGYTSPLVLYETATAFVGAVCFFRSTESCLPVSMTGLLASTIRLALPLLNIQLSKIDTTSRLPLGARL